MTTYLPLLKDLIENALKQHESIRWVGVVDITGTLLCVQMRPKLLPLLTDIENEEYARHAISRHKNRIKFDSKTGGLEYAIVKYEKVIRGIIPITDEIYLLIAFDIEENEFDYIITKKIAPLIEHSRIR